MSRMKDLIINVHEKQDPGVLPLSKDNVENQMKELLIAANWLGLYEAKDWIIKNFWKDNKKEKNNDY